VRQRLLRREIRARPGVGFERLSQIVPTLTEEPAVPDVGTELIGLVRSATALAERDGMIGACFEEHGPQSNKQHHDIPYHRHIGKSVKHEDKKFLWISVRTVDSG